MKKRKTFKTANSEWTNSNLQTKILGFIKYLKELEQEKNLKLLPIDDPNKLGVLYTAHEGQVSISFFDRTKTTSFFDVIQKGTEQQNDIVGEDCLYYPEFVGMAICPGWVPGRHNCGTLNIDMFIERLDKVGLLTE